MNIYDSMFSADGDACHLNEQTAREIFDILPDYGPVMLIMDKCNNCWPSNSEEFTKLNIHESFLRELCAKIDDGNEPVITQDEDCSIIATQLATERTNCGYIIVILPKYSPESTLANIDLLEILLGQVNLVAKLIEKNNLLYELQIKHQGLLSQGEMSLN